MNMFKKNGGFTLVELIVVIAILAILAGVAVPAYSGYIKKANEAADMTQLDAIKTAATFVTLEKSNGEGTVGAIAVSYSAENGLVVTVGGTPVDISDYYDVAGFTGFKSGASSAAISGDKWVLTYPAN